MQYILIIGDPIKGHECFGPFWSEKAAFEFGKRKYPNQAFEVTTLNKGL